jgi:hypothetical protein
MSVTLPVKTGGPAFPPFPSDATKYGLSVLGYFAGKALAGLCANPEVVDQAFIETLMAPTPAPSLIQPEPLSASHADPTSLGVLEYIFNATTVEPPTASHVRFDNIDQTLATKVWINKQTADAIDANRALIAIDELYGIYLQDKDDSSCNMSYNVTGKVIDKGVYVELPVTFIKGEAPLLEQHVLLSIYKLVAHSDLTAELLARIAYSIAAEMVEVRDQIPINPSPVPSSEEPPIEETIAPPLPQGTLHGTVLTTSGTPTA